MIVEEGKRALLEAQRAYLEELEVGLFTDNEVIADDTVVADLTEAAWTGYAPVALVAWGAVSYAGGRARLAPDDLATFSNGSGGDVTFRGWFVYHPGSSDLIAAVNLGADVTIPDGMTWTLALRTTLTQEV